jgi:hypothetical protein
MLGAGLAGLVKHGTAHTMPAAVEVLPDFTGEVVMGVLAAVDLRGEEPLTQRLIGLELEGLVDTMQQLIQGLEEAQVKLPAKALAVLELLFLNTQEGRQLLEAQFQLQAVTPTTPSLHQGRLHQHEPFCKN